MLDNNMNPEHPLFGMLDCTILKVAHYGSDGSSSLPFLRAVSPDWAIICAGVHHDHPHSPTLDRLGHPDLGLPDGHILRTDAEEDDQSSATEANLGDDCYQFVIDTEGIVKIEKWDIHITD